MLFLSHRAKRTCHHSPTYMTILVALKSDGFGFSALGPQRENKRGLRVGTGRPLLRFSERPSCTDVPSQGDQPLGPASRPFTINVARSYVGKNDRFAPLFLPALHILGIFWC